MGVTSREEDMAKSRRKLRDEGFKDLSPGVREGAAKDSESIESLRDKAKRLVKKF